MYSTSKLKTIRQKQGLTIYDMGKLLNMSGSAYFLIETKKRRLFYDTAFKIASIFNMKPDELFYTQNKEKG